MKRNTLDFYKDVIRCGQLARLSIGNARRDFENFSITERKELTDGTITEKGYEERLAKLAAERDGKIAQAQKAVLDIAEEFGAEMKAAAKLDGSQIDDSLLHILNSDLKLSREDWQELQEQYKDSWTASRLLQQKYDADPIYTDRSNGLVDGMLKEKVDLRFGVDPSRRAEIFSSFANLIACSAKSGTCLDEFDSQNDYWCDLARKSIRDIKPIEDDDFSDIDSQFPVEFATVQRPQVW